MRDAQFVRWTEEDGWKLYDLAELGRVAAALEGLENAVGFVNPRLPGWHNDLLQLFKKSLARVMDTEEPRAISTDGSRDKRDRRDAEQRTMEPQWFYVERNPTD